MQKDTINETAKVMEVEITEKQIEIFARRLLPEIKKIFTDETIQAEFKEWQIKRMEDM